MGGEEGDGRGKRVMGEGDGRGRREMGGGRGKTGGGGGRRTVSNKVR